MENRNARRGATKKYDIVSLAVELGYTPIPVGRNYMTLQEHDSVRIDLLSNTFTQYSTGAGGDAVSFLMAFGDIVDNRFKAVDYCIRYLEKKLRIDPKKATEIKVDPKVKGDIVLPEKDENNKRVWAYLHNSRCIDKDIINWFMKEHWLYQSKDYKNCVFVSYGTDKKPEYHMQRSSLPTSKFLYEDPNNNYDHCFFIDNHSDTLVVTEAIIDMMSLMTINKKNEIHKKHSFLSICSTSKDSAIYSHLKAHPEIKDVILSLDNDKAGRTAIIRIRSNIRKMFPYVSTMSMYPSLGTDWNDELVKRQTESKQEYEQRLQTDIDIEMTGMSNVYDNYSEMELADIYNYVKENSTLFDDFEYYIEKNHLKKETYKYIYNKDNLYKLASYLKENSLTLSDLSRNISEEEKVLAHDAHSLELSL